MIEINTTAILLGAAIGLPISVLFFYGLNWGMRLALASSSPGGLLLLSFFVRMTLLLAVAFVLIRFTNSLWSLAGYMLAFLLVRIVAVLRAKINPATHLTKQEGV